MNPGNSRMRLVQATMLSVGMALGVPACGSDDAAPAPGGQPGPDAGQEAGADAPAEAADEAGEDASDADVSQPVEAGDAAEDVAPDIEQEAGPTWEGPPWFGCTTAAEPPGATVVTAFDLADHYFNPEDKRTIESSAAFPDSGTWEKIDAVLELTCPADGDCDNWDRFANLMLVEGAGTPGEQAFELMRYVTPYNIPMCARMDVTGFGPRLVGQKTLRSFIDTWVGPTSSGQGHGWRVSVRFVFHPAAGGGAQVPDEMIPLWGSADVEVGNPDNAVLQQMAGQTVSVPADVTRAEIRVLATGHGQGNRMNCAEFCQLEQEVQVNGQPFSFNPWRADCKDNPIGPGQGGTWKLSRAGWCPGAVVVPQVFDVTDAIQPGQDNTFAYDIRHATLGVYENTCRPGAGDADNKCTACAFDSNPGNCDYNGGNHTQPVEKTSVQLLLYR